MTLLCHGSVGWLQENDLDRSDEISMFAVTDSHKVV